MRRLSLYSCAVGIDIDLGLERFYEGDEESWTRALEAIVESGVTNLVRDVIPGAKSARVYEASRSGGAVAGRWLTAAQAKPLLAEVRRIAKAGGCVSYSYDELEALGVECQALELIYDRKRTGLRDRIALPLSRTPVGVDDLAHTTRQWDDWDKRANLVCTMHDVATRYRLVVHYG